MRFLFLKSISSPHHASAVTGEMRGLRKLLWTLDSSDSSLHYVFIVLCVYCTVFSLHCWPGNLCYSVLKWKLQNKVFQYKNENFVDTTRCKKGAGKATCTQIIALANMQCKLGKVLVVRTWTMSRCLLQTLPFFSSNNSHHTHTDK